MRILSLWFFENSSNSNKDLLYGDSFDLSNGYSTSVFVVQQFMNESNRRMIHLRASKGIGSRRNSSGFISVGPVTRARAKKFKEELNCLIIKLHRDALDVIAKEEIQGEQHLSFINVIQANLGQG